jgi:TPR repeat protein
MQEAVRWYELSAAQKNPWATYKLAMIYIEGRFVERNRAKARSLLQISSAAGNKQATKALKRMPAAKPPKKKKKKKSG